MISDPQDLRRDLLGAEARGEAAESGRGRWGGLRASATGACVRKGAGTHTHRGDTVRTRRSCRGPRTKACDAPPRPQEGPALLPPALAPGCGHHSVLHAPVCGASLRHHVGETGPRPGTSHGRPASRCRRGRRHTPRRLQPAQRRGAGRAQGAVCAFRWRAPVSIK